MRKIIIALMCLFYGFSTPAFAAEKLIQQLDTLVKNNDVDGVENLIEKIVVDMSNPLQERNKNLRKIFSEFMTTRPEYISLMAKWSKDKPESIYAKTAKGWYLYHIAWLIRGETTVSEIYSKAADQMRDYFQSSATIAYEVTTTNSNFAPASDLALLSSQHAYFPTSKRTLTYTALISNRDTRTLSLVLRLYAPEWGGGLRKQKALCKEYEDILIKQDGYTADMCFAELIISDSMFTKPKSLTEEMIVWAYEIMEKAPKDKMLNARWADAVYRRPDIDGALELAAELLPSRSRTYPILARRIEVELSKEGFAADYAKTKRAELQVKFDRDPFNPDLLERMISHTYADYQKTRSPQTFALYEKYIDDAMVYGKYRPKIWKSKANPYSEKLFAAKFDADAIRTLVQIWEKAIKYSNYSPRYLADLYGILSFPKNVADMHVQFEQAGISAPEGTPEIDANAIREIIDCPLVRVARLYEVICSGNLHSSRCKGSEHPLNWPKVILKEAREKKICPARLIDTEESLFIDYEEWQKKL